MMAKSKKPRKAYNPRRYARTFTWWRMDNPDKVSAMNTDFGLWAHYGLERMRDGTVDIDTVITLGSIVRTARQLVPKMNEAEALNETIRRTEGAMTEVFFALRDGKRYDMRYVPIIDEGMPYVLEIVKHCSLKEIHDGVQAALKENVLLRLDLDGQA